MEKHILHGHLHRDVTKADPEAVRRLAGFGTATLVDVMGGHAAMHHEVKPLEHHYKISGNAVTVLTKPGDVLYVKAAIDMVAPGDVLVIAGGGLREAGVFGDRFAENFIRNGLSACVIDGVVRDSEGVIASGLPVWCRGSAIPYGSSTGPGAVNVPVACAGVGVTPGDIIIGDRDGIVVVPREDAERVIALCEAHLVAEYERARRMEAGESAFEVYRLKDPLARWS